jgi:hypothetical protein
VFVRMDASAMMARIRPDLKADFFVDLIEDGAPSSTLLHRRSVDDFLRFPTAPETHMAYAVTWCVTPSPRYVT